MACGSTMSSRSSCCLPFCWDYPNSKGNPRTWFLYCKRNGIAQGCKWGLCTGRHGVYHESLWKRDSGSIPARIPHFLVLLLLIIASPLWLFCSLDLRPYMVKTWIQNWMGILASVSATSEKIWPAASEAVKCFPEGIYLVSEPPELHISELSEAQICWQAAESTQNLMPYLRSVCIKLCLQI